MIQIELHDGVGVRVTRHEDSITLGLPRHWGTLERMSFEHGFQECWNLLNQEK